MNWASFKSAFLLTLMAAALWGCGPTREQIQANMAIRSYHTGDYEGSVQRLMPLARNTDENFVLNNVRLGSAALGAYDIGGAEAAFLRAYEVINSFGVNTGGRTLGAVLVSESIKVWKGEPFERAMANFYLGLVFYMEQDWNNARAAFENSLFKLRDYGEESKKPDKYEEQESNFVIAYIMLGRCWQKLGREDLARANFERAAELQPKIKLVADYNRNSQANVLLVVDYGWGPRKLTTVDGAVVGFCPTPKQAGRIPEPRLWIDGRMSELAGLRSPPIDLLDLAQQRQWQSIDTIRVIKSAIGTGMLAAGMYEANRHRSDKGLAAGLILGGLLLKATSQADVRVWEMLPRTTFVLPLHLPPGKHDLTVEFGGPEPCSQTWRGIISPSKGEATYYMRITPMTEPAYDWPPPATTRPIQPIGLAADGGN